MAAMSDAGTIPAEIARFDALAARWWDKRGPMRELHRMNPARTGWISERIAAQFGRPVRLLDLGCGAGIAAEAFARMGHDVLGVDAAAEALAAARAHAPPGLKLAYADRAPVGEIFDVVTALEVIEHVPDPTVFLRDLAGRLVPGGLVFVSTLNRTARSFAFAIVGAEYLVGLVPRGTHDWRRFVTPAELSRAMRGAGLRLADVAGLIPDPLRAGWRIGRDTAVNYIAMGHA